jgi:hypothetical protein
MKTRFAIFISLIFIVAACTAQETPQGEIIPPEEPLPSETPDQIEEIVFPSPPPETSGPDCYGTEANEIGLGITENYEGTIYEQVMTWFCNGAEFEDILVALQTEQLSNVPAEEMLIMLADDWTWEEIWQVIGLTEE